MQYLFLPPLIVFLIALTTQRIVLGLCIGIALAAYQMRSIEALEKILNNNLSAEHLLLFGFILITGWFLESLQYTGGLDRLFDHLKARISTAKQAETSSLILSLMLFFDGILSCLVVTSVLKPMSERFGIPPLKGAFLASAMGAPLTILCPFSCLTILYVGLTGSHDVKDVFLSTLPFCLFPLTLLVTLFFLVQRRWSFGLMKKQEEDYTPPACTPFAKSTKKRFILLPVGVFFAAILFLYPYYPSFPLLLIVSSLLGILTVLIQREVTLYSLCSLFKKSVQSNGRCLSVIFLAWLLADLLVNHPGLKAQVETSLLQALPPFLTPLLVFWGSIIVALTLGTLWGAIAFLIPFFTGEAESFIILGAILSGAALGDQITFVSDTMILASSRMGCRLLDLIKVQWQYMTPVFIGCSIGFLAAEWLSYATPLLSIAVSVGCFYLISKSAQIKAPHQHYSHQ